MNDSYDKPRNLMIPAQAAHRSDLMSPGIPG